MSKRTRRHFLAMISIGSATAAVAKNASSRSINIKNTHLISPAASGSTLIGVAAVKRLEAQFYHDAVHGPSGRFASTTAGAGRRVVFADAMVKRYTQEIAADKVEHLALLAPRTSEIRPAVDLSARPFERIAQTAGATAMLEGFDPYQDDHTFLLAAHMLESACAGVYRCALENGEGSAALTQLVADAGYHGGLIRSAIHARGDAHPTLAVAAKKVTEAMGQFTGDDAGRTELHATSNSAFFSKALSGQGGFFPAGLNVRPLLA